MKAIFLRALEETDDKDRVLREAIRLPEQAKGRTRFDVDPATFGQVPRSPFVYWVSDRVRAIFTKLPPFESDGRTAKQGLATADDFRFVRIWTEVGAQATEERWFPFAKGGKLSPFYADLHLVVDWCANGGAIRSFEDPSTGRLLSRPQNLDYFFRAGLTWPARPHRRGAFAIVPSGCVFSHTGTMVFEPTLDGLTATCAILNSNVFIGLLHLLMPRGAGAGGQTLKYEVGYVTSVPVPECETELAERLAELGMSALRFLRRIDSSKEISHAFHLPALLQLACDTLSDRVSTWSRRVAKTEAELARLQAEIDDRCFELYGIDGADRERIERGLGGSSVEAEAADAGEGEEEVAMREEVDAAPLVASLLSWSVGVAFGRLDIRLATGERPEPSEPEPFDSLPVCSPGMLTGEDGLPLDAPPSGYPIDFPRDGVRVDDAGGPRDLVAAARQVFELVFDDSAAHWEEAAEILGERDRTLRRWFAREFFGLHLRQYSRSRRKAPIYWPLSTASGSYTIWIYYHRLTADTLFQVVVEHLDPKICRVQEERLQVDGHLGRAEGREAAKLAKQAGELADFEQEMEEMKAELLRVAELPFKPNLNDGVQITAAPLWKLFRLPAWRKVLEITWSKLEKGEYDWAHLAFAIWPERVEEKCKTDRSLAIAHGQEDLCETVAPANRKRNGKFTR